MTLSNYMVLFSPASFRFIWFCIFEIKNGSTGEALRALYFNVSVDYCMVNWRIVLGSLLNKSSVNSIGLLTESANSLSKGFWFDYLSVFFAALSW